MRLAAAAAIIATAQALVAPTPQKTSTRLHGRATKLVIWDCDGVLVDVVEARGFESVDLRALEQGLAVDQDAVAVPDD